MEVVISVQARSVQNRQSPSRFSVRLLIQGLQNDKSIGLQAGAPLTFLKRRKRFQIREPCQSNKDKSEIARVIFR